MEKDSDLARSKLHSAVYALHWRIRASASSTKKKERVVVVREQIECYGFDSTVPCIHSREKRAPASVGWDSGFVVQPFHKHRLSPTLIYYNGFWSTGPFADNPARGTSKNHMYEVRQEDRPSLAEPFSRQNRWGFRISVYETFSSTMEEI